MTAGFGAAAIVVGAVAGAVAWSPRRTPWPGPGSAPTRSRRCGRGSSRARRSSPRSAGRSARSPASGRSWSASSSARSPGCSASGRTRWCSARCVGLAVGWAFARAVARRAGGDRRRGERWSSSGSSRPLVFRDPQVSLLAEEVDAERAAVRGAARGPRPGTSAPGTSRELAERTRRHVHGRRPRRRHRRLARRAGRAGLRSGRASTRGCASSTSTPPGSRSTSCREWRLWVRPGYLLYRTLVARPLGPGERADEPAGDPARRPQPHRHDQQPARRGRQRARLDPVVRRHRRADLRRHLHHLPGTASGGTSASGSRCRRPASRPRSSPGARDGRRPDPDQPRHRRAPGPLSDLCRPRHPQADGAERARLRRAARRVRHRRRAARRARLPGVRATVPRPALPDAPQGISDR